MKIRRLSFFLLVMLMSRPVTAQTAEETNAFIKKMVLKERPGAYEIKYVDYHTSSSCGAHLTFSKWSSREKDYRQDESNPYMFTFGYANISETSISGSTLTLRGGIKKWGVERGQYRMRSAIQLTFSSEKSAKRVLNAFNHMISLCDNSENDPF